MRDGARKVTDGSNATFYDCNDCGLVYSEYFNQTESLRPNNKFCDKDCMAHVIKYRSQKTKRLPNGALKWLKTFNESKDKQP